ncbi:MULTISPECIES: carbohydrate ABC transporter permease [unclassified Aureimonas]|uniref:carbohydrate ABC transporter permease n=1 Tax=unclassified Aureimonas TaxID=2615206 RepID=UPI0007012AAD|nr:MULTISPECIES: sugar ABC transporter permease [unclassified Aureimonas]KQT57361.1 sugar ABC transporter permease [Aureimonas sp. Leaf427]KQT77039.1 sugar ABC transporter permease [Aureimonas sp. Leaf460]
MSTTAAPRRGLSRLLDNRKTLVAVLLAPVIVFFVVFNTIPTLWLLGLSFYNFSLTGGMPPDFVGFRNFIQIFNSKNAIWYDLSRTFTFVLFGVGIQTVLGAALGFLFWGSKDMPGRRLALTLLFAPMVLTPVATGTFFRFIYDPTFGVLNAMSSGLFDTGPIDFLGNPAIAFWAVLAVDCWMWTPFMTLMTLAALGSVPKAELEAAEIDRIPFHRRLSLVIWHHGKFILMLGILLRTIDSFKTLDLIIPMTKGGPGQQTRLVAIELNKQAFESFNMGWSSAYSVLLLLISIAMTSVFIFVLNLRRRREG